MYGLHVKSCVILIITIIILFSENDVEFESKKGVIDNVLRSRIPPFF